MCYANDAAAPGCKRFQFPSDYLQDARSVFNPAAAYDPQQGWIVLMRHDQCYSCSVSDHHTAVLVSQLGPMPLTNLTHDTFMGHLDTVKMGMKLPIPEAVGNDEVIIEDVR